MCMFVLFITSFSFQISGAVLLLLWSLTKCDKKIKKMSTESNLYWIEIDDKGEKIGLSKEKLQKNARTVYKNILAFFDILIGYFSAVFLKETQQGAWEKFVGVLILTIIIVFVEILIAKCIAKRNYPKDQDVYLDEIK